MEASRTNSDACRTTLFDWQVWAAAPSPAERGNGVADRPMVDRVFLRTAMAAAGLIVVAAALTLLAGTMALRAYRDAVVQEKLHHYEGLVRSLVALLERQADPAQGGPAGDSAPSREDAGGERSGGEPGVASAGAFVQRLTALWASIEPPDEQAYLCLVGADGRLTFHSRRPERVGTDVSAVRLSDEMPPRTVAELLQSGLVWSGVNVNMSGERQIVCYRYCRPLRSLVVVHLPLRVVDEAVWSTARPWDAALRLLGFGLLPLCVGLIVCAMWRGHRQILGTFGELQRQFRSSRKQLAELETLYRTAPVGLCRLSADQRIERINDWLAAACGVNEQQVLGRSLASAAPLLQQLIGETCRYVLRTGQTVVDHERTWVVNGRKRTVLVSCAPVHGTDGGEGGLAGIVGVT